MNNLNMESKKVLEKIQSLLNILDLSWDTAENDEKLELIDKVKKEINILEIINNLINEKLKQIGNAHNDK